MVTSSSATAEEIAQVMAAHSANAPPRLTAEGEFLSATFSDLRMAQGGGGMGPGPIGWSEIKDYCDLMEIRLSRWALRLFRIADAVFMKWAAKQAEKK